MSEILVDNQQDVVPVLPELAETVTRVALRTLARAGARLGEQVEVAVTFVGDAAIKDLNRDHRGLAQATDVLSFSQLEPGEGEPVVPVRPGEPLVLGDVVVSLERAQEQASEYGHSFEREVGFLVCHGVLHLLGFDHQTPADEEQMASLAEDILTGLGLTR